MLTTVVVLSLFCTAASKPISAELAEAAPLSSSFGSTNPGIAYVTKGTKTFGSLKTKNNATVFEAADPTKKLDKLSFVGSPRSDCTCSYSCDCGGADNYAQCLNNLDPWSCQIFTATEACNAAASACPMLDITCTPTSTGCDFQCESFGPTPGLSGAGCADGYLNFFNAVCLITPLAIFLYIVLVGSLFGLLYKFVKKCFASSGSNDHYTRS